MHYLFIPFLLSAPQPNHALLESIRPSLGFGPLFSLGSHAEPDALPGHSTPAQLCPNGMPGRTMFIFDF